jgi:hypothetical protein
MFTRYSVGHHRRGNKNTVQTCPKACIGALSSNSSTIPRPDLMNIEPALRGARTAASLLETSRGGATSRIRGHFSGMGRSASTSSTRGIASPPVNVRTYQLVFSAYNAHRFGKPHCRLQQPISNRFGKRHRRNPHETEWSGFWTLRHFSQLISDLETSSA